MILYLSMALATAEENWEQINWWNDWPDQQLSAFIEEGLQSSPDVLITAARIEQAKAAAGQQRASFLPSVSASWSSNTQPRDALGFGFGLSSMDDLMPSIPGQEVEEEEEDDTVDLFTAGTAALRMDIPLDVWKMGYSSYEAAKIDVLANQENQEAALRNLSFAIANAYYDVMLAEQQLHFIEEQIELTNKLLEITMLRHERGEASVLDVLQQEQQVASTGTQLPRGEQQLQLAKQQLLVLMGQAPSGTVEISEDFPELSSFTVSDVEQWISARPDVQAAQLSVEAAEKRKYSAMANMLPAFSIGGQLSRQANYADEEWDSLDAWSMSTGASITLFQGGSKVENLRSANSAVVIAEETLRQTKLRAEQEASQVLLAEQTQESIVDASSVQLNAAMRSFEEAQRQYAQGLVPFMTLLSTQQAYQQAQINDIQTQREQVRARLQSYLALGIIQGEVSQ